MVAAHEDHRDVRGHGICLQPLEDFQSVDARQRDVQNDCVGLHFNGQFPSFLGRISARNLETSTLEKVTRGIRNLGVIIYDQDKR